MGSMIEINDTLQITSEQGFPAELVLEEHLNKPLAAQDFEGKVFDFKNKSNIRFYHIPPTRVFLAHNIDGRWLYWGLVQILSVSHNYESKTTGGTFKIDYIYTPEEMKKVHDILDRSEKTRYFG